MTLKVFLSRLEVQWKNPKSKPKATLDGLMTSLIIASAHVGIHRVWHTWGILAVPTRLVPQVLQVARDHGTPPPASHCTILLLRLSDLQPSWFLELPQTFQEACFTTPLHMLFSLSEMLFSMPAPQLVVNPGRQVLTPPSRLDQPPLPYGLTAPRILLPSPYHDFSFLGSHDWGQTLSLFCLPLAFQSFTHSKHSTNFCVWTNDRQVENQWTHNFLLNSGWKRFYRLKFWDRM